MRSSVALGFMRIMLAMGALSLVACRGPAGSTGAEGSSCTVATNGDGSATITCEDGTSATVAGEAGSSCTVVENGDGTATISCEDGTSATVTGEAGSSCSVTDNGDGTSTITCEDGTTVTVSDGEDGEDGENGENGVPGASYFYLAAEVPDSLVVTVTGIDIAGPPVVDFTIKDAAGRGAVGATVSSSGGNLRFGLVKLVPGTNGDPDAWQSYINRASSGVTQATVDRSGTLVDHQDGSYTYTYSVDVTNATDPVTGESISYDPTLTHRLAIQLSGSVNGVSLPYYNATYDFVPNGDALTQVRELVSTASCNECHGKLTAHGSRYETKYCVTCHNPGTMDSDNGATVDFPVLVHGIHSADLRAEQGAAAYMAGGNDYSEVLFPQDLKNCLKCHNGADSDTPQGDNWKNAPTMNACGSCHATVDFATGTNHEGGAQASNAYCSACHTPSKIEEYHYTDNASPNSPGVPDGAYNFTYEIKSVTVSESYQPVITFRILKDGEALNFSSLPSDLTGSPSFLVAYTVPQGEVDTPADWNQLGKSAAQPASVSISKLIDGSQGTLSGPDAEGYYIATLTTSSALYPSNATMRAAVLQGYYSQSDFQGSGESLARHTISVITGVTGDPARREVVDSAKCANCHEWFEGHGGNRVYTTAVCAVCHNANLSSSGRGSDPANISTSTAEALTAAGYDPTNPLTFPEASNDFKSLVHGIHSPTLKDAPYEFVRDRGSSGVYYYDFSEVTFPGVLNNCETCHVAGTYSTALPANVLVTTNRISDGTDATTDAVKAARSTVPNDTDLVSTPISAACYSCHTTDIALAHIEDNGGAIASPRSTVLTGYTETCDLCHGSGRTADVEVVHDLQ